MARPAYRSG